MPKLIEELVDALNLKSLKAGGFKRNFIFTVGSKAFVISMSFVFTPILSRLFLPEDYGLFSLYSTIIANYIIFSTFGFSDAMNVAREDRDFYALLVLCSALYAFFAIILLVLD